MKIAYIDAQNIRLWVRELGRELDWKKFFVYLTMKHKVIRVKLYIWYMSKNKELYRSLEEIWYILIFKKTYEYQDDNQKTIVKWNVDTILTLDAIKDYYLWNISHGILVSWDGDFDMMIDFWIEQNVWFDIMVPNHHKIPLLFKHYPQKHNPLIVVEDLRYKVCI
jgi:uncharacterized LabA/DUF88 family protein